MSDKEINDATIRDYLLSRLSEAETLPLDELSVADDSFAARITQVENDLVDSYVADGLDNDSRLTFEKHYFASPLRRAKVEFARTFNDYVERQSQAAVPPDTNSGLWNSLIAWFDRGRFAMPLAVAAVVVIAAGVLFWTYRNSPVETGPVAEISTNTDLKRDEPLPAPKDPENDEAVKRESEAELARLRRESEAQERRIEAERKRAEALIDGRKQEVRRTQPAIATTLSLFPQLRSSSVPTLKLEPNTRLASFKLGSEASAGRSAQVTLRAMETGEVVWTKNVRPSRAPGGSSLALAVPASVLKTGTYNFTVSTRGASPEIIGDYTFKVVQ